MLDDNLGVVFCSLVVFFCLLVWAVLVPLTKRSSRRTPRLAYPGPRTASFKLAPVQKPTDSTVIRASSIPIRGYLARKDERRKEDILEQVFHSRTK